MATSNEYFYGLGRRKEATARARVIGGKGEIVVNGKTAEEYFNGNTTMLAELTDPLALVGKQKELDVSLVISGGGMSGQVDAAKLAITKAIGEMDETMKATLKKAGHFKRDPREKERKKYGLRSARKREQFSKR